jgi:hypothetical protein
MQTSFDTITPADRRFCPAGNGGGGGGGPR